MNSSNDKLIYDMALQDYLGRFNVSAGRRRSPYRARKSKITQNGLSTVEVYKQGQSKFLGLYNRPEKVTNRYAAVPNFGPYKNNESKNIVIFSELEKRAEAESKSQQRFMGMVYAYKQGELPNAPASVRKAARNMSLAQVKDYAETSHKGLPEKKANNMYPKKYGQGMLSEGMLSEIIDRHVTAGKGPLRMKYFSHV